MRGFTLIELLMTIAIIVMLVAILLPALAAMRHRSRAFNCQINQRAVAFDFAAFATPSVPMRRGNDSRDPRVGLGQFRLETFQESQYRIDEFWDRPGRLFIGRAEQLGVMGCPEVADAVQLRAGRGCRDSAVTPPEAVAYAMNLRLDRAEGRINGQWIARPTILSERILEFSQVPLIWDIDGDVAADRLITPHYSAPPGDPAAPYGSGREWFPAIRRHGRLQVGFVGGEVRTSSDPLSEHSWLWTLNP